MSSRPPFSDEVTPLIVVDVDVVGKDFEDGRRHPGEKETTTADIDGDDATATTETTTTASSSTTRASALSWFRFSLFFSAAVLTGGVLPGQNVYSRLFCEAGLFRYACEGEGGGDHYDDDAFEDGGFGSTPGTASCCMAQWLLSANTMNILTVVMTPLFLIGGLAFDMLGARSTAILGCVLNALGFAVLAILLWALRTGDDDAGGIIIGPFFETVVFVVSILLIDLGMMTTNTAFMGFLWHLPHQQALVLSLSTSCANIAALIPLVVRSILRATGLSLQAILGFYVLSILLVATPVCWWTVPSDDEFRRTAMAVLGMPLPRKKMSRTLKEVGRVLRAGLDILLRDKRFHLFTMLTMTLFTMGPFVYMTMADPMGTAIFDRDLDRTESTDVVVVVVTESSGERLATIFNRWNAALGFVVGPIVGVLVDRSPRPKEALWNMLWPVGAATLVVGVCCPIPSWGVQTMNVILVCFSQICAVLFVMRYAILFAPPHRTGTVSSLLMTSMGALGLVPLVGTTACILVFSSYTAPTAALCFLATAVGAVYAGYVREHDPWPDSPPLLPDDEREISATFAVGTIEEAAYVAGISVEEFRKLSSSSKVLDQRRLLSAAFTAEAADRILEVAKKRYRNDDGGRPLPPMPESCTVPRLPIPRPNGATAAAAGGYEIVRGTAETALETILLSFNGHGGFGGKAEPTLDFSLSSWIEDPDDPVRLASVEAMMGPTVHCAEHYGTILEVRVPSSSSSPSAGFEVAAACCVYHPGGLDEKGSVMQVGSDRYYFCLASYGKPPIYLDRERFGSRMLQSFGEKARWERRREEHGRPMWYVNVLGTHPKHQGRGCGRMLLDAVASWADGSGSDCYLECSESNVAFYEKSGYGPVWKETVEVEGRILPNYGMVRKPRKKRPSSSSSSRDDGLVVVVGNRDDDRRRRRRTNPLRFCLDE